MALSLSQTARQNLKNLLVCFSLGNLCFVRRWYDLEILTEPGLDYHRSGPPSPILLMSTLVAGLLLAVLFYAGWLWAKRGGRLPMKIAQCAFLLTLIFPLESVRRYWNFQLGHFDLASNVALMCLEAVLFSGLVMAARGNPRVVKPARHMALLMTLMFPALLLDFAGGKLTAEPASAFRAKPSAPALPVQADGKRFIWLIFDEMDQKVAFDARPASLELPELDRLRSESVEARRATQTAEWTGIALPSLISGRYFRVTQIAGASKLDVYEEGSAEREDWRSLPSVFQHAREQGVNTAVSGWYHPYCRLFGDELVQCFAAPSSHAGKAMLRERHASQNGLWNTVGFLFRLQWENVKDVYRFDGKSGSEELKAAYLQTEQQREYFQIRDHAYAQAVDPTLGLVLVHVPAPHMYAIYNRRDRSFKLNPTLDYLDNLALVDRTVGELRQKLEQAGLWDRTSLLITADHGFRPNLWRGQYGWTPVMEQLFAAGASPTVPFILKLAGERQHAVYNRQFSNIISGELALQVLKGTISNSDQATTWLDDHLPEASVHAAQPTAGSAAE